MGRNRTRYKRMPKGWTPIGNAVYFVPTNAADLDIVLRATGKKSLRLGALADHNECAATYAEKIVKARGARDLAEPGTVAELTFMARRDLLPTIANPKTRKERERHFNSLEQLFGPRRYARNVYEASRDTAGVYLRAMDIQKHLFEGRAARHVAVNREVRSWEILFQWARAPWGRTEYNPCSGLMENDERPRRVIPEDDGIFKLYRHLDPPARFMVVLIRYYGRRKVEQLALELTDAKDDGIHLRRGKDADSKAIILKWDPRLRKAHARLMRWREEVIRPTKRNKAGRLSPAPRVVSTAMILNRRGGRYTESGFNSARKRAMKRAGIAGAFTFHDMRKSRGQSLTPIEAQNVLAHDDPRTTNAIYRPGAIVVDLNDEVKAKARRK